LVSRGGAEGAEEDLELDEITDTIVDESTIDLDPFESPSLRVNKPHS
jgi:hypothetical protein